MSPLLLVLVYLLFFWSGAAALVYQVVWVRSLTLVFGGSHLAVTAVLTIFMAGLALGARAIGRRADRLRDPLRLYGLLELGIAVSALVSSGLMTLYPALYGWLAAGRDDATGYLTAVRLLFSVLVFIVPTALMGATLPVLARFVAREPVALRRHLPFLYGLNTLGAVAGALLAGFVLLRVYAVSTTLYLAVATNAAIGAAGLLLARRWPASGAAPAAALDTAARPDSQHAVPEGFLTSLVLWGIGVSGFCALGYEVLWTRVLTVAVGASVYGFTIMLVAFLLGLALGSHIYGAATRMFPAAAGRPRTLAAWFGLTEVAIGVTALLVTIYLRDIPATAVRLQHALGSDLSSFNGRAWTSFVLALLYMTVPALLMGAAFPQAGELVAMRRQAVGRGVGEVLAANTIGAIAGAAASGLLFIRLFGIERSLQILTLVNVGAGLTILVARRRRAAAAIPALATLAAIAFVGLHPHATSLWNRKYFAVFRSNQPEAFRTPEMIREAVENTDVLFYAEGVESIVSVIRVKGGEQAFITNGRIEASSHLQAQQVQLTLGYLPVLLAANPANVLVVGLGSGMTAGAAAVHPDVRQVTLVELEPQVVGVARTFEAYNHKVLDNPKVHLIFNDGRNFLTTTRRRFDVITADPIHPWFRGAGYLYTSEYFRAAAEHLNPGGVVAQWLPIYELTPVDLASVVRTFQQQFRYTALWLTHYDSVMVGSNTPLRLDETAIGSRMQSPAVAADLGRVSMGSAADLLSYFVMGTEGMSRFGRAGTLNTDDRPYLEFRAPFSMATPSVMAENVAAIAADRESILPYLTAAADPGARAQQRDRWNAKLAAARVADPALALFLGGQSDDPRFLQSLRRLNVEFPAYAPGTFLAAEYQRRMAMEPRLLERSMLAVVNDNGQVTPIDMCAVLVPVSATRASLMFVDNHAKVVYGESYLDRIDGDAAAGLASDVMRAVQSAYDIEAGAARERRRPAPSARLLAPRLKAIISAKVQRVQPGS